MTGRIRCLQIWVSRAIGAYPTLSSKINYAAFKSFQAKYPQATIVTWLEWELVTINNMLQTFSVCGDCIDMSACQEYMQKMLSDRPQLPTS